MQQYYLLSALTTFNKISDNHTKLAYSAMTIEVSTFC